MELALERHELLDLGIIPPDLQISCQAGSCWLTLSGDRHDHILRPGQQFISRQRGHLLVTATAECRIKIVYQASIRRPFFFWMGLNNLDLRLPLDKRLA
mgnify:CR=1 FL=1